MSDTVNITHFAFMESYYKALNRLVENGDYSRCGRMALVISEYALYGREPNTEEFDGMEALAWELIFPVVKNSRQKAISGKIGGGKGKGVSRNVGNNHATKDDEQNNSRTKANQKQIKSRTKANQKQIKSRTKANQKQIKTDKDKDKDMDMDKGECVGHTRTHTNEGETSDEYKNFMVWLGEECSHLLEFEHTFTEKEFKGIFQAYEKEDVFECLRRMENVPNLCTKYRSVNRTCRNWLKKDGITKKGGSV